MKIDKSILNELDHELHTGEVVIYNKFPVCRYCIWLHTRLVQLRNETTIFNSSTDKSNIEKILINETEIGLIKTYENWNQTNKNFEIKKLKYFRTLIHFLMSHSANYESNNNTNFIAKL